MNPLKPGDGFKEHVDTLEIAQHPRNKRSRASFFGVTGTNSSSRNPLWMIVVRQRGIPILSR